MIIVFGSINVDVIMPVQHFPAPGETVLCATDYLSRTGGKGGNQAVAACRAGAKVAMVGKVGDDAFGRRSVNNLKMQSVLTTGIGVSDRPTGCSSIALDETGKNMVITAPGANADIMADQVPDEVLTRKNIVLAQMEGAPQETVALLARARARGTRTILNASPAHALTREVLGTVDYLVVNEVEALQMAGAFGIGETDPCLVAAGLAALADLACIVTLEARGSAAARKKEIWVQEALAVETVDSTGAGDAFCGIFAACLQEGRDWAKALHIASVGASLSCLGLGAQAGMPFMEDILARLPEVPEPRRVS